MTLAKSKSGSSHLATMENDLGVKLHLDDRQSAAVIYADDCDQAEAAEHTLMELLSSKIADVAKDILLRGYEYPPGLMKVGKKSLYRAWLSVV